MKEHKWLTFCVTRNLVFCFYCRLAATRGLLSFSKNASDAFVSKGFNNWKKAKERFREHEQSHAHSEACVKISALKQPSVAAQLSTKVLMDQEKHRNLLLKQLDCLQYLTRQGIAVRGHHDEDGNLYQLLKCRADDIVGMQQWIEGGSYQSHDIINEMIQLMATQLLQKLLKEIRSAEWYSIIADETRDISGAEQLGISVRWVENDYQVHEDLIGLVEVEMTDSATLCTIIKDVLL